MSKYTCVLIVQCTYTEVELPSKSTNAVVLSRPAGNWGAEVGANDHGVTVGCSQLHTSDNITGGLTAQDLVRSVMTGHLPPAGNTSG